MKSKKLATGRIEASLELMEKERLFTRAFILVIVANFANALGAQMANSILPVHVIALGKSEFLAGMITGMLAFTACLLRPFVGWLVDAWRRRPMVLIGTGCYTIANFMYAAFSSWPILFVSRFIHGFGLSNYTTASSAFVADISPPHRRAEAMGYYAIVMDIGLLGGPALAFFLIQYTGLQHIFYLTAALSGLAFLISIPVREHRKPRTGPLPPWKPATGIVAKAALPAAWIAFCMGMGVGPILAFIAIFARQRGIANPGLFFTVQAVALIVSRAFSGRLADKHGRSFVIIPGLMCIAAGLLLLPFVHTMFNLLTAAAVLGFGFGSSQPATMALTIDLVSLNDRGMAVSTFFLGFDSGISLGSFLSGAIATAFNYNTAWSVAAIFVLLGIIGIRRSGQTAPSHTPIST
jgi:MFS family permease